MSTFGRLISYEDWINHLYSSRYFNREAHDYWPEYFPRRQLVRDENIVLQKVFWKMFFATRDFQEVEEFWLTYFMMTTIMKDYFFEYNEEITKVCRVTMEGQFEHDLYIESFRSQLESDETDVLQQRIDCWMTVVHRGGPLPDDVYDYNLDELFDPNRKAVDPET